MLRQNAIEPGRPFKSQAVGSAVSPSGEAQQASARRATMTTVALIGSMAFSCLDSPSPFRAKDLVTNLTALVDVGHQVKRSTRRWCVHREGTTLHRI